MKTHRIPLVTAILACLPISLFASIHIEPKATLLSEPQLWQPLEMSLSGIPEITNPFDPELIAVDAVFRMPSGDSMEVPAFWYQAYTRQKVDGAEKLTTDGEPGWRLRFTPTEPGAYHLGIRITLAGEALPVGNEIVFDVAPQAIDQQHGWVQIANKRYFRTSDGHPLRLIGENVCWDIGRGTYDYDEWFKAMADSGQNFARLWFSPWSVGIEHQPGTLNHYSLSDAWQLDYIFSLAEHYGIYLMISFDHHGMYQTHEKTWGGTNAFWHKNNPYSKTLGGPCETPNDFFSMPEARALYQKRLRYLIARWGYSPYLHSWQFFNEIDNVFPRENLNEPMVYDWHAVMGSWLKAHDPYQHLVTTSLTGGSDRPEMWQIPEMDLAVYHSYHDPAPARTIAQITKSFTERYDKPMMVGEFGTSAWGLNIKEDPHMRGFRQGLWGGVTGGSVGTAMSWWWENIHWENLYPIYDSMSRILNEARWQEGEWKPMDIPVQMPPEQLGDAIPNTDPFDADLALNGFRRIRLRGSAAIANSLSAKRSSELLQNYLRNTTEPQNTPMTLEARFAPEGKLNLRIDSVSGDCKLVVKIDGEIVFEKALTESAMKSPDNQSCTIAVSEGLHRIELLNTSGEWIHLETVQLQRVRPSQYAGDWQFQPEVFGLQRNRERAILYVVSPHIVYPANAHQLFPPEVGSFILSMPDLQKGVYALQLYSPINGDLLTTLRVRPGNRVELTIPDFREDLVAVVTRIP